MLGSDRTPATMLKRMGLAMILVEFLFILLAGRLWYLQIIKGEELRRKAENNRVRIVEVPAPRGIIYDRYGKILADNRLTFNLTLIAEKGPVPSETLAKLEEILGVDIEKASFDNPRAQPSRLRPVVIKKNLSRKELAILETHKLELSGLSVSMVPRRLYPQAKLSAHLLGYTGEIGAKEVKAEKFRGLTIGSQVGRTGLEELYDQVIRGTKGVLALEVDSRGVQTGVVVEEQPRPGNNLILTLDADLQLIAEQAMAGKTGAVVALNPQNGQILVLASAPAFDPNMFAEVLSPQAWRKLLSHPGRPLQNRAIQGQYPPASTFKVVTALAGLEEGIITPKTRYYDPGFVRLDGWVFRGWRREGHGWVNLRRALTVSCDIFFYRLGLALGIEKLSEYAYRLGLGERTGTFGGYEKAGLIPSEEFRRRYLRRPWYPGEAAILAVGQSFHLVTPIQLVNLYATLANGGRLYRPWLVERIETPDGKLLKRFSSELINTPNINQKHLEEIKKGLISAVNDPEGTGYSARLANVTLAGKTGTAQVVRGTRKNNTQSNLNDHAWFVGFAPAQEAEIALVVLVENGGSGGGVAAKVARKVLEAYFQLKQRRSQLVLLPPSPDQIGGSHQPLDISQDGDSISAWVPLGQSSARVKRRR